jgi:hypothetical protein
MPMFTALQANQGNYVQIGQITPPFPSALMLFLLLWFFIILLLIYVVRQCS